MDNEIWKPIKGHEDYLISSKGRCISKERDIIMKNGLVYHRKMQYKVPHDNGRGYLAYLIDGKHKYIHRIVATTFIPNPDNKPEIDHIDGDKKNNCVGNLRWVTHSENLMNPSTHWKMREVQNKCPIIMLNSFGEYIREFVCIKEATDFLGVTRSSINSILNKRKGIMSCKGFTFVRKEEYDPNKNYSFSYYRKRSKEKSVINDNVIATYYNETFEDVFCSKKEAGLFYGTDRHTITRYIKKNEPLLKGNSRAVGRLFYALSTAPENIKKEIINRFFEKYVKPTRDLSFPLQSYSQVFPHTQPSASD